MALLIGVNYFVFIAIQLFFVKYHSGSLPSNSFAEVGSCPLERRPFETALTYNSQLPGKYLICLR